MFEKLLSTLFLLPSVVLSIVNFIILLLCLLDISWGKFRLWEWFQSHAARLAVAMMSIATAGSYFYIQNGQDIPKPDPIPAVLCTMMWGVIWYLFFDALYPSRHQIISQEHSEDEPPKNPSAKYLSVIIPNVINIIKYLATIEGIANTNEIQTIDFSEDKIKVAMAASEGDAKVYSMGTKQKLAGG